MKKLIASALTLSMVLVYVSLCASAADKATETIGYTYSAGDGTAYTREMEALDRGLIAVKTDGGVFLSWRLLDSEDNVFGSAESNVSFDIYRDGTKIHTESATTNYVDPSGTVNNTYSVVRSDDIPETRVIDIGSDSITVYSNEVGAKVYAAKYNDSLLDKAASFTITSPGENTFTTDFTADKVFIWDSMKPIEGSISGAVKPLSNNYFDIPLVKPANEVIDEGGTMATKSFSPTDCSAGDLDGDGEYEIVVKWVSQECDVGNGGYSGTVRLAAYKLDGTRLWDNDVNLGKNVYSSAHTVQFLVYDFDGNGKAEMMCQTSLGSKDAAGEYVSHSAKPDAIVASTRHKIAEFTDEENAEADFNGYDRKVSGEEFLTVFNGETGEAVDTIDLPTTRGTSNGIQYGDDFGNRSNRFVADVAYLDGEKPYAVYMRGYYFGKNGRQRTSIAGISFDGDRLSPDYRFDTQKNQPGYYDGAYQYVGQGNHNCTVADVDNDGKDEFITGALCMEVKDDNTFKPRWCTYLQHGDALHIGDYDPTHKGLEFFTVHEDEGTNTLSGEDIIMDFGMSVIDASTGDIIFHKGNTKDTGRGVMANTGSGGFYQITGVGSYQCNGGTNFTYTANGAGSNFRIFWDGDLYDNLLDGTNVTDWNGNGMSSIFNASSYGCVQINGTKANPALQADLFGDWREELIYPTKDGTKLRVFTTTTPTEYKVKTLMHDPVYRSGVAAEQTAYNQPPHVGFYLAEDVFDDVDSIEITSYPDTDVFAQGDDMDTTGLEITAHLTDGTSKQVNAYTLSGYDKDTIGTQTITVTYKNKTAEFDVTVKAISGISVINSPEEVVQGQKINKKELEVWAHYEDGGHKVITDYELLYSTDTLGETSVTVSYRQQTTEFNINVIETNVSSLNGTYETTNTSESDPTIVPLGNYTGNFTLTHTVNIASMPANAANDKNLTAGFFVRFMPSEEGDKPGVGAGWQLSTSNGWWDTGEINAYWKSDGRAPTRITTSPLELNKTYTFIYEFTNVGTGAGALVNLTIKDENDNTVGSGTGLSLRNMTSSANHTSLPLNYVQIYNQAKENSTASVTFNNAQITAD